MFNRSSKEGVSGIAKGLLALSAILTPSTVASAQERRDDALVKEAPGSEWNPLVLPYVPERTRPPLGTQVAGFSLIVNSAAKDLLDQFDKASRARGRAEPELAQQLFEKLSFEPGTEVAPERFRALIARYPESPVRAAMLKYVYYSPNTTLSDATLLQFWGSSDADVLKWALLNQSRTINANRAEGFFKNIRESTIPDIRIATSIALISAGFEPLSLNNSEILKASLLLTEEHLSAGHETRLVELMARNIAGSGLTDLNFDEVRAVAAPLLHLLQRTTRLSNKFSESLLSADSAAFDRFSVSLLKTICYARANVADKVVLSKDSRILVGLHYERMFTNVMVKQLFDNIGVSRITYVKAGNLQGAPSGPYGTETRAFPDSTYRQEFLKELERIKSPDPKQAYLEELKELARDRSAPALVWNIMHGSPRQFWFYHGQAGVKPPDELRDPRGISDIEVVEALISDEDLARGEIDLSHMTFITDACRQYTLAEGVLNEIERVAHRRGVPVKGYPTFVVLTQPYMYGNLFFSVFSEVPEPGDSSSLPKEGIEVGMTLYGPFDRGLRRLGKSDQPALLRDLFAADSEALTSHREALKDPKRLRALSIESMTPTGSRAVDPLGLREITTQDPAVFSPLPISLEVLKKACVESGISTEGLQEDRSTFLEVSEWTPSVWPIQRRVGFIM
jgi:hypothetical protein